MKESRRVLLALIAAIVLGVLSAASQNAALIRAADAIAPVGTLWVNAIRMTVIPLVVSLVITGVASVSDVKSIGRLGGRTLVTFLLLLIGVAAVVIPVALAIFALLPAHVADGSYGSCLDCTSGGPCAGGGSGALALKTSTGWVCK